MKLINANKATSDIRARFCKKNCQICNRYPQCCKSCRIADCIGTIEDQPEAKKRAPSNG